MTDDIDDANVLGSLSTQHGGLIEVCVFDTTYNDWFRVVEALRHAGLVVSMVEINDDAPVEFGPELFDSNADYRLTLHVGEQTWTTNFFDVGSIDFQGDPREVISSKNLREVTRFMTLIRDATSRQVVLIPETLDPRNVKPYLTIS